MATASLAASLSAADLAEALKLTDGARTVDAITADLATRFTAPPEQVGADVIGMLQDLADKAVMENAGAG